MERPEPVPPPDSGHRLRDRGFAVDVAAAVALTVLVAYTIQDPPGPAAATTHGTIWLTAGATALPVAVRRRWPSQVFSVTAAAAVAATLAGVLGFGAIWVTYLPTALALYTVALNRPAVWSVGALTAGLLGSVAAVRYCYATVLPRLGPAEGEVPLFWQLEAGMVAAVMGLGWGIGWLVGWRRALAGRLARQLAREAVAEERLRIARELHDIVGHSMSLIAVKATVANHIADTRPDETRQALGVIEQTSRATLVEIRRLLGILRSDTDPPADLAPTPGPAELAHLAERAQAAGVEVELTVRGADTLPEALGLSVYRIVQEALTNVVTHAAPARCHVTVAADGEVVRIEVTDDGQRRSVGPARSGGGHGLIGMRERVAMYGGTFTAGPRPEGGYAVVAELPYGRTRKPR